MTPHTRIVSMAVALAALAALTSGCSDQPPPPKPAVARPLCGGTIDIGLATAAYGELGGSRTVFLTPKTAEERYLCRPNLDFDFEISGFKLGTDHKVPPFAEATTPLTGGLVGLSGTGGVTATLVFRTCAIDGEKIVVAGNASRRSKTPLSTEQRNAQARLAVRAANLFAQYTKCQGAPLPDVRSAIDPKRIIPARQIRQLSTRQPICGWLSPLAVQLPTRPVFLNSPGVIRQTPVRATPLEECFVGLSLWSAAFRAFRGVLADRAYLKNLLYESDRLAPATSPIPGAKTPSGVVEGYHRNAWIETTCKGQPVIYVVKRSDEYGVSMADVAKAVITEVERRDGCESSFV